MENRAKITNRIKTVRKCCEEETMGNLEETIIMIKGKWRNIQEAINKEYSMEEREIASVRSAKRRKGKEEGIEQRKQ